MIELLLLQRGGAKLIKLKNMIKSAAAVAAAVILTGCSDISFGEQTVLRPPRATGDRAEIQTIISEQAGSGYTLKYPQRGEYRSAITVFTTGNNNEYAVALYSGDNDSTLNLSIIAHEEDNWVCLGSFTNTGTGVDRIMLEDINNDGKDEILVGWSGYNSTRNTLSAYSMENETVREMVIDEYYTDIVVADITDDKSDDIVLLSLRNAQTQSPSSAKLLQYSEQEKRPIGKFSIELDSEVTSFANVSVGKITENKLGVFLDGEKTGGLMTTQVIYYSSDKNSLLNPLVTLTESGSVTNPTTRKYVINSKDIDGDGYIEVPVVSQMAASSDENAGSVCTMTTWKQLDIKDGSLKTRLNTVINYTDGYYFVMPDEWVGNVTALNDPENRQVTFYLWSSKTSSSGDKLLIIYRFTRSGWNKQNKDEYIRLDKASESGSDSVIAAQLFHTDAKDSLNLTEDQLADIVKILS